MQISRNKKERHVMRIAFLGKGGSGKTTISSGFIEYLNKKQQKVLAIDADLNVHVGETLNMETKPLNVFEKEIIQKLEPVLSKNFPILGCTPPHENSKFISFQDKEKFVKAYATQKGNISLLTLGTYDQSGIGATCYHSMLSTVEFISNRLLDGREDRVVYDMTAGIDSVGTGMFSLADINVFVVEPTQRSIDVYLDFARVTKEMGLNLFVLLNKIEDAEDIKFVQQFVPQEKIIAYVEKSSAMKNFDRGSKESFQTFVAENQKSWEMLDELLQKTPKNWYAYQQRMVNIYRENCRTWYNDYYGKDLTATIDEGFKYLNVI